MRAGTRRHTPLSPLTRPVAVDWPTYKALCERPDVMPRAMLERTSALLPAALADTLRTARAKTPFPKPEDHKGDAATDMFALALRPADTRAILAAVETAAAEGRTTHAVVAAWREANDHIAGAP